jgi:hypothetical protein
MIKNQVFKFCDNYRQKGQGDQLVAVGGDPSPVAAKHTLAAHKCDVIMGVPQGDDLVQVTNPYYRTAYALVLKPGSHVFVERGGRLPRIAVVVPFLPFNARAS